MNRIAMSPVEEWITKRDPAIAGKDGDLHTVLTIYHVLDMGAEAGEAWALIKRWNTTCIPPWPDSELRKKFDHTLRKRTSRLKRLIESDAKALDESLKQLSDRPLPSSHESPFRHFRSFLPPLALVGIGVVTVLAIRRGRRSSEKADLSAITAPLPLEGGADMSVSDSS